jgi:hypothetical protein
MKITLATPVLLIIGLSVSSAHAQELAAEVSELRQLLTTMQADYDARISDLEVRLARAERQSRSAQRDAEEAIDLAEQTAIDQTSAPSAPNIFNPAIGAILTGQYAEVDNGWDRIPGFQPAGEIGTGETGFALGEAEINLKANVDAKYFGNLTVGIGEHDGEVEVELEEAWLQTTDLPAGLSALGGRFFSEAGYLNGFHFHADDFVDRPLPYQAFFGGRYTVDGLQARWIAPTSLLFEIGGEVNWGGGFPATANENNAPGAWTAFSNLGGDVGESHSWQLGFSWIRADAVDSSGNGHPAAIRSGRMSNCRANISVVPKGGCMPDYPMMGIKRAGMCRVYGSSCRPGGSDCDMTPSMQTTDHYSSARVSRTRGAHRVAAA